MTENYADKMKHASRMMCGTGVQSPWQENPLAGERAVACESQSCSSWSTIFLPTRVHAGVTDHGSPVKLVLRLKTTSGVGRTDRKWPRISAGRLAFGRFRGRRPYCGT